MSSNNTLIPGSLLVAPPTMMDINFRKAVVLLCEHSDEGSFGLILNRSISLEMMDVVTELSGYTESIHLGGPVQTNTLHFLHRLPEVLPEARHVSNDVYWGGDFEQLQELIQHRPPTFAELRFFLGYAGWTAGQLEAEIEAGGWIVSPSDTELIFYGHPGRLWREVMVRMGGEYALLANYPTDPRMN